MAVNETYDFETGLDGWSETGNANNTVERSASAGLNGSSYGMRFVANAQNSGNGYSEKALATDYTDIYAQCRVKWVDGGHTVPTGDLEFMSFRQSSITRFPVDLVWSGSAYEIHVGGTNRQTMTQNTEYVIEVRVVVDAVNGGYQAWVDGTQVADEIGSDTSAYTEINTMRFGANGIGGNVVVDTEIHWDDIKIGDTYIGVAAGGSSAVAIMVQMN